MSKQSILITGSAGLIGSEVCQAFDDRGLPVHGLDNNQRREFFGPDGDTSWNQKRLENSLKNYTHHAVDIRNRPAVVTTPDGEFVAARPIGVVGQSFDHRAFDGAYSAAFLSRLKALIEGRDWAAEFQ